MALVHGRIGFSTLETFVQSFADAVGVLWVDKSNHDRAWEMMISRAGRRLSFVDCTMIVLAKSLQATVFAFDEDFAREGLGVIS